MMFGGPRIIRAAGDGFGAAARAALTPEERVDAICDRYARGEITLEQLDRELDAIYFGDRLPPARGIGPVIHFAFVAAGVLFGLAAWRRPGRRSWL